MYKPWKQVFCNDDLTVTIECSRFLEHPCSFFLARVHAATQLVTSDGFSEVSQFV